MNIKRVECPSCGHTAELPEEEAKTGIMCPACSSSFTVLVDSPLSDEDQTEALAQRARDEAEFNRLMRHIYHIKRNARIFAAAGAIFGIFSLVALIYGLIALKSAEDSGPDFRACGYFAVIAIALYIGSQIIHIRANTER